MKSLIFILLFKSLIVFGQDYTVTPRTIKLDSIEVKFFYNQKVDGIEAESYFKKSNSKLRTIYNLDENNTFYLIVVQEKSKNSDDTWRTNVFQYENGKMFYQKESYYSTINGKAVEHSKSDSEIYNKKLGTEFLKKYIVEVYNKIKNYR